MQETPDSGNEQEIEKDKVKTVGEDKVETPEKDGTQSQTGLVDTPAPPTQDQGATKTTEVEKEKSEETSLTLKPKELLAIQVLVTLP